MTRFFIAFVLSLMVAFIVPWGIRQGEHRNIHVTKQQSYQISDVPASFILPMELHVG